MLPDSTLKSMSPKYLFRHPDVASTRTRECASALSDRLEVIVGSDTESDFWVRLLDRIKGLSRSDLVYEKLRGLNVVVFIIVVSFVISHFIMLSGPVLSLSLVIVYPFSVFLALIPAFGYEWLSEVLVNMVQAKVFWLRASTIVLMAGIPTSVGALAFNKPLLAGIALGIVGLGALTIFLGSFLDAPSLGCSRFRCCAWEIEGHAGHGREYSRHSRLLDVRRVDHCWGKVRRHMIESWPPKCPSTHKKNS